jgi:ABC-2 type transport system ATP-binding protein
MQVRGVTKSFGGRRVLDDIEFDVQPRRVTALLGPNGSGKTTLMKISLSLMEADRGDVFWDGSRYRELERPLNKVGALLDVNAAHPGRSALNHLWALGLTHGVSKKRAMELLDKVGLASVAKKRVSTYSLGMKQRLGIAAALVGDPDYLIFDEPTNGLDVDGLIWFRELLIELVAEGKTILYSSHSIDEIEKTSHDLRVIGQGKLLFSGSTKEFKGLVLADALDHALQDFESAYAAFIRSALDYVAVK